MISITLSAEDGPARLFVRKAGQVAHPAGMCATSRTNMDSLYAVCEDMRTLSRPRADRLTVDQLSARRMNLFPTTKKQEVDRRYNN